MSTQLYSSIDTTIKTRDSGIEGDDDDASLNSYQISKLLQM